MGRKSSIDGFHVIIAAAGHGARMGADIPKQYLQIGGKTILRHTLDNVLGWPTIKSVRVIIDPSHAELYQKAVKGLDLPEFIAGGEERNVSINNALSNISNLNNEDIILIHDAARPFTKTEDIEKLLNALETNRAATLACPLSDTLRKAEGETAGEIIDRNGLWALQTPQAFRFGDLKNAHDKADKTTKYTDDTSLVSAIGIDVALVPASRTNIKITNAEDMDMASALLSGNYRTATGIGFDVHAFEEKPSGKALVLGGVKIQNDKALSGHSDADVVLHAITDAILGAIGEGDIGLHFPPSDDAFKDMDSAIFLQKTMEMVHERGGQVENIDLTIICEEPKITPHRDAIHDRIAAITSLPLPHINVKATTTEKLGFTGRGEGIASQAIATVKLPVS